MAIFYNGNISDIFYIDLEKFNTINVVNMICFFEKEHCTAKAMLKLDSMLNIIYHAKKF